MTGIPEPAYKTHDDAKDAAVMLRLTGLHEADPRTYSLRELKAACKKQADVGIDPIDVGTVEVGLFLVTDEYETLKAYARSLKIERPKIRVRRKR